MFVSFYYFIFYIIVIIILFREKKYAFLPGPSTENAGSEYWALVRSTLRMLEQKMEK